ncbi:MAG: glycerate kinase [Verrucomicrobia bacterium]|nr:glycerate kinase [Verrucomicrobiota bacterium]
MRIGIAPDSFKGSLSASQAADCIEAGFRKVFGSRLVAVKVPMADGGEGTVRAVVESTGGRFVSARVRDPLGRRIRAEYGLSGDGKTAIIEMAAASGLPLLKPSERNPLLTSTFGTGELILDAARRGVKQIILGIGGSATVDGGTGMARALGVRFLDKRGKEIAEGGGSLTDLTTIDVSGLLKNLRGLCIDVACDVASPLSGPTGAARMFGPQKGATPAMVRQLDAGLKNLARVIRKEMNLDLERIPGTGAAGGIGVSLIAFLSAELKSGVSLVIDCVQLENRVKGCDLVVTGEGRMDGQTVHGKTPAGVTRVARKLGIPVIAICGSAGKDVQKVHSIGITAFFTALQQSMDESELARRGPEMLRTCAEQVARMMKMMWVV